ncbi:MAG: hypothetical protein KGL39_14295 [Patescibacteria group bacterium]|nr:hypothetical protein [Patescibacteria group bacterium]
MMLAPQEEQSDVVALGRTSPSSSALSPEHKLWRAVIRQAILDRLMLNDEANRWLYGPSDVADATAFLFHDPYFEEICAMVKLSPDAIRARVKTAEARMGSGLLSRYRKLIPTIADYIMGDISPVKSFGEKEGDD